jgi:alkanesulfonate monooxygenase SsuD/methylene tetrahydromethanopterin reductase-like flavin-dependent oxidoreductase (luciferase family)
MKFGYFLRPAWSYEGMLELAKHAEELGLHGAYINDHVIGLFNEAKMPFLEAMTTMAAIGAQTHRIRIGHIVIMNSLRNPAFLAKTLTTLDHITGGRLDIIIGAGWNQKEYEGYDLIGNGSGMPSAMERVNRLMEAVQIMHGMFDANEFSYEGRYWKLKSAYNYPLPIQRPLEIQIGASKPHLISLAVRHADGFNIRGDLEVLRWAKSIYVKELEKLGKDPRRFHYTGFEHTMILCKSDVEYDAVARQQAARWKRTPEYVKANFFLGTPEALVEKLRAADDLGVEMMIIYPRPADKVSEAKTRLSEFRDLVANQL